jgi:Lar family restriction alleviation protein
MSETKLLPCPFCGGEAYIEQIGTPRQSCVVECGSCGLRHDSGDEGQRCGTSWNRRTDALYTMDQMREYAEAFHQSRIAANGAEPLHKFALIRDRNFEGEGLSLWTWNGENYSGADGDCLSRDADGTLDGFTAEWLTDHQLEQRLNTTPVSSGPRYDWTVSGMKQSETGNWVMADAHEPAQTVQDTAN